MHVFKSRVVQIVSEATTIGWFLQVIAVSKLLRTLVFIIQGIDDDASIQPTSEEVSCLALLCHVDCSVCNLIYMHNI